MVIEDYRKLPTGVNSNLDILATLLKSTRRRERKCLFPILAAHKGGSVLVRLVDDLHDTLTAGVLFYFRVRKAMLLWHINSAQEGDLWLSFPLSSRNCLPKQT
jgi:hypothetical protein